MILYWNKNQKGMTNKANNVEALIFCLINFIERHRTICPYRHDDMIRNVCLTRTNLVSYT